MKKILLPLSLLLLMFSFFTTYANETPPLNRVEIVLDVNISPGYKGFDIKGKLTDGTKTYYSNAVATNEQNTASLVFDVDSFTPGKKFSFTLTSGAETVQYYANFYEKNVPLELQTYTHLVEDIPTPVSTFHMHAAIENDMPIKMFREYVPYSMSLAPKYYDGYIYVPASEGAKAMGVSNIEYDATTGKLIYKILKKELILNVGSKEVEAFNNIYTLDGPVIKVNEIPYIPLESFAKIVEADLLIQDEGTHVNAAVWFSDVVRREIDNQFENEYINTLDISSDTEYLIWVKKSDYTVRVYKGTTHNWNMVNALTCSVGKLYTPTCTGTFKYYSKENRWTYSSYYVGPIMRFNGGYAIHTTLIRYDGTPYDDRVGMNLSHGCVRLQPHDMEWLINTAPLYTTIYITEN